MKCFEYGKENEEIMVILHGGGVSYRGAIPMAEYMARKYHVLIWAYDGFNPDEPNTEFVSVEYEAKKLGDYIIKNYNGKIDILYAVSYGCFVMLDVLSDKRLTVKTTIADGMATMDYPDIKNKLLRKIFLFFFTGFAYQMIGRAGKLRKKIICKAMGRTLEEFDQVVYRDATWQSWVNEDDCMIGRHMNLAVFSNTDMHVWHGINGNVDKKLATNIQKWKDAGYQFEHKLFTGIGHGGFFSSQPETFFKEVVAAYGARE